MENGRNKGVAAVLFDLDNTLIATRKGDKQACGKLAQILWEKWGVPVETASNACKNFLRNFRKCPENLSMSLDSWRRLLWSQALGEQYNKLAVVTLTGEEKQLDVEASDKIINIKEKLEEREGIPPEQQRLIHQGKQLKDDRTLESYKLTAGAVLHLVVALRGGGNGLSLIWPTYSSMSEGEVYQTWLQLRYDYLALTSDVVCLLQKLRQHYRVGLITNGTSRAQWEKINRLHLLKFFDVVLVSGDLPWEKPNQKIFHVACEYLGVRPQQCIMVGDKLETDILGGVAANLGGTVWVPLNNATPMDLEDGYPQPDHVIGHVTELMGLLQQQKSRRNSRVRLPDLEDGNSNSSDGS